jgi:hypothetical protein
VLAVSIDPAQENSEKNSEDVRKVLKKTTEKAAWIRRAA